MIADKVCKKCLILKMQLVFQGRHRIHLMTMQLVSHRTELTLQLSYN